MVISNHEVHEGHEETIWLFFMRFMFFMVNSLIRQFA
jgi:hypothetical protein